MVRYVFRNSDPRLPFNDSCLSYAMDIILNKMSFLKLHEASELPMAWDLTWHGTSISPVVESQSLAVQPPALPRAGRG